MPDEKKTLMAWVRANPLKALIILIMAESAILVILFGIFIWLMVSK